MKWDRDTPCASCPYRRDAPLGLWHPIEFAKLLGMDRSHLGAIYQCHETRKLPDEERQPCAGWLYDQKRRHIPGVALRVLLRGSAPARECFSRVRPGDGVELFESIEEMCRANGVRPPR